jgi:VWFA-related protein
LLEDGQPQTVIGFEAVQVPLSPTLPSVPAPASSVGRVSTNVGEETRRSFAIVIDTVHLSPIQAEKAKAALGSFLTTGLRDGDHVNLVASGDGTAWSAAIPEGRKDLVAFLRRLGGLRLADTSTAQISDWEAMKISSQGDASVTAQVLKRFFDLEAMLDPRDADPRLANVHGDIAGGRGIVQARAAAVYAEAIAREKATAGALEQVLRGLAGVRGRKSVLLVSAGFIYDPRNSRVPELLKACARANAALYFLDARGSEPPAMVGAEGRRTVESRDLSAFLDRFKFDAEGTEAVAADSGGLTVKGNDLAAGLKRVADESSIYYLLGYQPANIKRDGTFRRITVTLRKPGLRLRARSGYFARSSDPPAVAAESEGPSPEVRAALSVPFGRSEIPLRISSYELGPREGKVHVALVIEADPRALGGGATGGGPATFETTLLVVARDSGQGWLQEHRLDVRLSEELRSHLASSWLPLQRGLDLPAGRYQARVVWRDVATGRLGSVIHDFTVADPTAFHIAGPILTDLLEPARPGEAPRPALVARRRFALGTKLQCQFEVFGAQLDGHGQHQVTAGHIITYGATVISRLDPTPLPPGPQGQLSRAMVITLRGVPPGVYQLAITARDEVTGRSTEAQEAFVVEPPTAGLTASPAGVSITPASPDSYRGLVERYLKGQHADTARELTAWPRARWEEGARAAPGMGCDASCLRGAALLHTEAAVADRARGQNSAAGAHLGQAHDLLHRIQDDTFRRAWLLAVGYHLQGYVILSPAQRHFEECLKSNPSDAQALLALGTIHELRSVLEGLEPRTRGTLEPGGSAGLLPDFLRAAESEREAREAETLYRRAIKADPNLVEAHLRIGRVWQRRGKGDDARREFDWVLRNGQDHELLFLARLFLGVQEQMANHVSEAGVHFRAALDLIPHAQSARLALSLAQHATGDARAAQATARAALWPAAEKATSPDPWVSYHLGLSRLFDAALVDLRGRVSP